MESEKDAKPSPAESSDAKRSFSTPLAILVAGIVVALAVVYVGKSGTPTLDGELPTQELQAAVRSVSALDHVFGSRDADVMLIEYSDFECPFCAKIHQTLQDIITSSNGNIAWTYRHFPLTSIHANALPTALASECVAKLQGNDAFWAFAKAMFQAPALNEQTAVASAEALGVSKDAFRICLAEREFEPRVREDFDEAISLGGQGTPFIVVIHKSGRKTSFSGALPREYIEQIIATVEKR